jgi:polysaccharide export outer membrane protein
MALFADNRVTRVRWLVIVVVLALNAGCALVPGMDTYGMREQSKVKLPVKRADGVVPEHIKVREITAELIIDQESQLASRPTETALAPDPAIDEYDYLLGPGDIISIIVWDHPELTIPAGSYRTAEQAGTVVAEDGTIYFPYAGIVHVGGRTLREVRLVLTQKLSRYIENVQLDVRIAAFRSKRIYVVGEVNEPGIREVTDIPPTIIEAINRSGGFTEESDHSQITLTRADKTYRIDLQALYEEGDLSQNVMLQAGDVVNVPDRQFNKVFILGEVSNPGSYVMDKRRKTLAEALGDARDIRQVTSNPHQIFVLRGGVDQPEIYHLDSKTPDALLLADRFPLQPRDVVFVDAAEVVRWNRLISNILPTSTLLNTWSNSAYPLFSTSPAQ